LSCSLLHTAPCQPHTPDRTAPSDQQQGQPPAGSSAQHLHHTLPLHPISRIHMPVAARLWSSFTRSASVSTALHLCQSWASHTQGTQQPCTASSFFVKLPVDGNRCNKPGHMKGECPENKKEKHKKIHKFKKLKAMAATWFDEDSSEKEEEEKSSSSESEEICFMANSSDGKARSTLPPSSVDTIQPKSTLTSSNVDTYPCLGISGRPHGRLQPLKSAATLPSSFLHLFLSLLPFVSTFPSSALPPFRAFMAPKQIPRRGVRSRATARPIPVDEAPLSERRSKRRHDPVEQPEPSSASPSSAKR
ncbi:hypothetical protein Taro_041176, partial [Colocasia esculenta]|nr:hypothetical protein [Colocasia esculenta]